MDDSVIKAALSGDQGDMNAHKTMGPVLSSAFLVLLGCGTSVLGIGVTTTSTTTSGAGSGGGGGGPSTGSGGDQGSATSSSSSATISSNGGATGTSSSSSSGGAGGGEPGSCPSGTHPEFTVLDFQYPSFGPAGCSGDNTLAFLSAAEVIQETVLRLHVRKDDGQPFAQPWLLRLYVGVGPTCPNPPNVVKTTKAAVVGMVDQTVDLTIEPYDAVWNPQETKQFWIGQDEGGFTSWRATGTVSVQKTCAPCSPVVNNVSPLTATLNQATTFTIAGSCLPSTIAPFISQCANLMVTSIGVNQATFQCTPSFSTGLQSGVVKDMPGGNVLRNFTVSVN